MQLSPVIAPLEAPDRIALLAEGFDVAPLRAALAANPHLWNQNTARTAPADSPHHEADDIWCRFAPPGSGGGVEHFSVWYPAAGVLPVREMARELMAMFGGTALGGILITRIPAGKSVKPHTDRSWHAQFYDKFAVQVAAEPGQTFAFHGQSLETRPGDVFSFNNAFNHWVDNPTKHDRVTAIFCLRIERGAM